MSFFFLAHPVHSGSFPLSICFIICSTIRRAASSVEWPGLNPNCLELSRLFSVR